MRKMVESGIDRMKTSAEAMPLILVGGGAILVERKFAGVSSIETPEHAGVANAVGAAIGQISGEVDRIYQIDGTGRHAALEDAAEKARALAIRAGAVPASVEIVDAEVAPLQYLPGGAVRVVCRAVGDLSLEGARHAA